MTQSRYDLLSLKTEINLAQFAASYGYQLDRKKSTKTSIAMKSINDKIIVTRKGGKWVYFSVFNDQDKGTIIDFLLHRSSLNVSEIVKTLADWSGNSVEVKTWQVTEPQADPGRVQSVFNKCKVVAAHPYLESRGLTADLLSSERFCGRVLQDCYGNAVFPHFDQAKVCGLELKNAERGVLVRGSKKTFWRSNIFPGDKRLVITESVIDALSYHQLYEHPQSFYFATGGGISATQVALLLKFLVRQTDLEMIIVATDSDDAGNRLAIQIRDAITGCDYAGQIRRRRSKNHKDWNEVLQAATQTKTAQSKSCRKQNKELRV